MDQINSVPKPGHSRLDSVLRITIVILVRVATVGYLAMGAISADKRITAQRMFTPHAGCFLWTTAGIW
jgi:hypothetical protein